MTQHSTKKKHAIAIVVNNAYAKYAVSLIQSIKTNWPLHPQILLHLHVDVSFEIASYFESLNQVSIVRFDPNNFEYRKLLIDNQTTFGSNSFHDSGYFILNFWNTNFDEFENILILDADMLVLKDLDALINQKEFVGISAANERFIPAFSFKGNAIKRSRQYFVYTFKAWMKGIFVLPKQSLNSGVILLTPQDRTTKNYTLLLNLLKGFKNACPSDQEIILLWAIKTKKKISTDFIYNFQIRFFNEMKENRLIKQLKSPIKNASDNIHILHFNGIKPDEPDFLKKGWGKNRIELVKMFEQYRVNLKNSSNG